MIETLSVVGWLFLTVVVGLITWGVALSIYDNHKLAGTNDVPSYLLLTSVICFLWYCIIISCPFTVTISS